MKKNITHYTSVENLKKIIESKKIRFNRLDKVDDITEYKRLQNEYLSKYVFVSCWTNSNRENIALWNMYGNSMKGVCISLEEFPFEFQDSNNNIVSIDEAKCKSKSKEQNIKVALPKNIEENGEIYIEKMRLLNGNIANNNFLKNICYKNVIVSDTEEFYEDNPYYTGSIRIVPDNIAILKHIDWKFQNEVRYILYVNRIGYEPIGLINAIFNHVSTLPFTNIDVPIHEQYLSKMKITLGPLCSKSDEEDLREIAYSVSSKIIIEKSFWSDKIRPAS